MRVPRDRGAGDVSRTGLADFALTRNAGRTQIEATVVRRARLRKVLALLQRRGFCRLGSLARTLIAGAAIAVGAVTAAFLVRRLRTALPRPELRVSLPGNRRRRPRCARPPPQPGELRYIAGAGSWMIRPNFAGSLSESSRGTKKYSAPAGSSVTRSRASSPCTVRPCGTSFGSAA